MEKQTEKLITVIMNQVVEGIPNLQGGYLEQPIESAATRYLENSGGFADAAVSAAAYELLTPLCYPSWSKSVWRGTLRAVVGQLPWVGTATAVFTSQFESLWKQIRFFALAATLYGHNPRDEATQCQIVLCLLDDKLLNGGTTSSGDDGEAKDTKARLDFETELKQGTLKFAATVVARRVVVQYSISTINSTVVFNRVLGGLLAGVMPGVVHSLYNVVALGNKYETQEHLAKKVSLAVKTSKEHFKAEEQPTLAVARGALIAWLIPNILKQGVKVDSLARRFVLQNEFMETHLASLTMWYLFEATFLFLIGLMIVYFGYWKKISYGITKIGSRLPPWLVSTITLLLRAFLHFLSVKSTALSFAISFTRADIYHGHRALVGITSLISRKSFAKDLNIQPWLPFVHGSLLIWILYSLVVWISSYVVMIISVLATDMSSYDKLLELHYGLESSGFTLSRVSDALDVVSTVALHVLVHQIQRSEIIISLLGPVTVVDGILFAAKSLGTFVTKPDLILQWLASASPPPLFAWMIFASQTCSMFLGIFWGFLAEISLGVTDREKYVATYAVLLTVCLVSKDRKLPPPFHKKTWEQALSTRHRLLFLIPELDSGVKSKLHFVIKFFEQYEKAFVHTASTWTASVNWLEKKWFDIKLATQKYISNGKEVGDFQLIETEDIPSNLDVIDQESSSSSYFSWFHSKSNPDIHHGNENEDDELKNDEIVQDIDDTNENKEKEVINEDISSDDENEKQKPIDINENITEDFVTTASSDKNPEVNRSYYFSWFRSESNKVTIVAEGYNGSSNSTPYDGIELEKEVLSVAANNDNESVSENSFDENECDDESKSNDAKLSGEGSQEDQFASSSYFSWFRAGSPKFVGRTVVSEAIVVDSGVSIESEVVEMEKTEHKSQEPVEEQPSGRSSCSSPLNEQTNEIQAECTGTHNGMIDENRDKTTMLENNVEETVPEEAETSNSISYMSWFRSAKHEESVALNCVDVETSAKDMKTSSYNFLWRRKNEKELESNVAETPDDSVKPESEDKAKSSYLPWFRSTKVNTNDEILDTSGKDNQVEETTEKSDQHSTIAAGKSDRETKSSYLPWFRSTVVGTISESNDNIRKEIEENVESSDEENIQEEKTTEKPFLPWSRFKGSKETNAGPEDVAALEKLIGEETKNAPSYFHRFLNFQTKEKPEDVEMDDLGSETNSLDENTYQREEDNEQVSMSPESS